MPDYNDETYSLTKDPSNNVPGKLQDRSGQRAIELGVTTPNLRLKYTLYRDNEFELSLDFPDLESGKGTYTVQKKPIEHLTSQEAEIIGYYTLSFMDTAGRAKKQAA